MFRFIEQWIVRVLLTIILIIAAVFFTKDVLLKWYFDIRLAKTTGFSMKVESIHLDVRDWTLTAKNLDVAHPPILGSLPLASVKEAKITIRPVALLTKKIRISQMDLNIDYVQSIESKTGGSTREYLQRLAATIDSQFDQSGWVYGGLDKLNITIDHHQKVNLEDPTKITSYRDLKSSKYSYTELWKPSDFLNTFVQILYPGATILEKIIEKLT